jgi:hypothetical protein
MKLLSNIDPTETTLEFLPSGKEIKEHDLTAHYFIEIGKGRSREVIEVLNAQLVGKDVRLVATCVRGVKGTTVHFHTIDQGAIILPEEDPDPPIVTDDVSPVTIKHLAIMGKPHVGIRDIDHAIMWFDVRFGDELSQGALIIIDWDTAKQLIETAGIVDIDTLAGKPCQIAVQDNFVHFIKVLS